MLAQCLTGLPVKTLHFTSLDWGCVCMDGGDVGRRMVVTARLTKRNVCFKKFYLIVNFLIL